MAYEFEVRRCQLQIIDCRIMYILQWLEGAVDGRPQRSYDLVPWPLEDSENDAIDMVGHLRPHCIDPFLVGRLGMKLS